MSTTYTDEALQIVIERMERVIRSHGPMGADELRASICRPAGMVRAALVLAGEQGRLMRLGSGRIGLCVEPVVPPPAAEPAQTGPKPGTVAGRALALLDGSDAPLDAPAVAAALGISEGHACTELCGLRSRGMVVGVRICGRTLYAVTGSEAAEKMNTIQKITKVQARTLRRLSRATAPMPAREATAAAQYSLGLMLELEARGLAQSEKSTQRRRVYRITDAGRAALATLGAMA